MNFRRSIKTLAALLLAGLAWGAWVGFSIASFGKHDFKGRADCAIVLGAAATGSTPSPVFEERIHHAIDLWRAGRISKIVFTGGRAEMVPEAESSVARDFAIAAGIPADAILIETRSHTTRGNLLEARDLMKSNSLRSAVIVSDPLHLKRASIMAADLQLQAVTSPTPTSKYRSLKTQFPFLLREIYFYHHYLIFGK